LREKDSQMGRGKKGRKGMNKGGGSHCNSSKTMGGSFRKNKKTEGE